METAALLLLVLVEPEHVLSALLAVGGIWLTVRFIGEGG